MKKIKAVLFDYDGTIVDTNDLILRSWRHTYMKLLGRECEDSEVTDTFGEFLRDTMIQKFPDEDPEMCMQIYREYQGPHYEEAIKLCPGMKELIALLKSRGYITAIVTSRLKKSTFEGLQKFGIEDLFDLVVCASDDIAHKPDPEGIFIALNQLNLSADEAIYVGDSKYDIQCGHNAGMKAVLVDWTVCLPEDRRVGENKPDYVLEKATDLLDYLEAIE